MRLIQRSKSACLRRGNTSRADHCRTELDILLHKVYLYKNLSFQHAEQHMLSSARSLWLWCPSVEHAEAGIARYLPKVQDYNMVVANKNLVSHLVFLLAKKHSAKAVMTTHFPGEAMILFSQMVSDNTVVFLMSKPRSPKYWESI